jgi:CheY-like chemotaxis protein
LRIHGLAVDVVGTKAAAVSALQSATSWDGLLLDVRLDGDVDGLDVLDIVVASRPESPRALISAWLAPGVVNRAELVRPFGEGVRDDARRCPAYSGHRDHLFRAIVTARFASS